MPCATSRRLRAYLPLAAAAVIVAGCGSSNNNNNNKGGGGNAFTQPGVATVATQVSGGGAAASATKAPAGGAAASATNASGSGAAASATKPAASGSAASGGPRDAALQGILDKAVLTDKDLPSGYTSFSQGLGGNQSKNLSQPGETASAGDIFIKAGAGSGANPLAGQFVIAALGGFKDADGAKVALKELKAQGLGGAGGDTTFEPVANAPKLGDETLAYKITSTSASTPVSGYAIAWRRGKVDAIVWLAGAPAPKSVDEVTPIAKKQDDKLKALGQ